MTGYDLHIWSDNKDDTVATELQVLNSGTEMPWRFDDWKSMREVSISFLTPLSPTEF